MHKKTSLMHIKAKSIYKSAKQLETVGSPEQVFFKNLRDFFFCDKAFCARKDILNASDKVTDSQIFIVTRIWVKLIKEHIDKNS